jgi:hypothetical protein
MSWQDTLVLTSLVGATAYLLVRSLRAHMRSLRQKRACARCPLAGSVGAPAPSDARTKGTLDRRQAG